MTEGTVDYGWFSIVLARSSDIPTVHDIDSISLVSSVSPEWLQTRHEHYKDRFLIARRHQNGEIIGYLTAAHHMYYPEQLPGYVYLSRFAVKEQFRRCGIGTALLVTLYEHLIDAKEYCGVVGDVRKSNVVSLKFFIGKHCFLKHGDLSRPNWYEKGETEDDKYKIVVFKPFF